MSVLTGIMYFLLFAVLLPGELLWWGCSLDGILKDSRLAKWIDLCFFTELPKNVVLVIGILAFGCMLRAIVGLSRRSHAADPLLYGCFPLYMVSLLLYFGKPCALAVELPLIVLGAAAVWHAYRPAGRPPFFRVPRDRKSKATLKCRLWAMFLLTGQLFVAGVVFQEDVQLWLAVSPWTWILIFLPLLGVLLPTAAQIRDYLANSVYALVLCCVLCGAGAMVIEDCSLQADYEIAVGCIFLLLELSLMIRPFLPPIRNNSLLILAACCVAVWGIIPNFEDVSIPAFSIALSAYVLYSLIDNRRVIRGNLLLLVRHLPKPRFDVRREFTALSWGVAAMLAVYLAGTEKEYFIPVLSGIGAVFAGSLLRVYFQNNPRSDHIILRNFPFAIEIFFLLLTGIAICNLLAVMIPLPDPDRDVDALARGWLMIVLGAFAAAAALMQTVWYGGGPAGKYTDRYPSDLLMLSLGNAGICFLLVLLFFLQVPASLLLGYFFILSGILRIRASSSGWSGGNLGLTTGWVLIAIGQFMFVASSKARLEPPDWTSYAAIVGAVAFAASYLTWLFDFYLRKRKKK